MAIVGDAYIVVRAITAGVEKDIKKAFDGSGDIGRKTGEKVGDDFQKGFRRRGVVKGGLFGPNFAAQATRASDRLSSLVRTGYFVGPAISSAAGAIGALGTILLSLGSVISAATLPALVTLAGALVAVGLAAITAKLAFAGVGKAISAGNKVAKDAAKNDKALKAAKDRLKRAQEDLADVISDSIKSEAAAVRAVTDTREAYNEALKNSREELQQLAFDSEDSAISEQKAALELEKARETLARVSDLPPNSRARKEAELAFAEADLNYRRAIDANNDLKTKEAENAKLGPDLETQAKNQKDVLRAQRDVNDALATQKENELDNVKAIKRSTEARDEAQKEVDDFAKNTAAANAYEDALAGLSKEAQSFVKYIVSLKDEFKALKAAAGEKLFPLLEIAIDNLVKNLFPTLKPLLRDIGESLGKVAVGFSKTITEADNLKRLKNIVKTSNDFVEKLGLAANNLYTSFLILLDAAKPLIDAFGDFLVNVTGSWKQTLILDEKSGKLAKTFETAKGILTDLGKIFGNVFGGLGKIISANVGPGSGGQFLLDYLKDATGRFKNISEIDGKPLKEFFLGAAENGAKLLSLLGNIVGELIKLADDEGLGIFFDKLSKVVDIFGRIGTNLNGAAPAMGDFLIAIANITETLTQSESITVFFNTLTFIVNKINEFLKSDIGQRLIDITALVLPFLLALKTIFAVASFAFKAVAGAAIKLYQSFGILQAAIAFLGTPLGIVVIAVAALVAIFIGAYTQSEKLRTAVKMLIDAGLGALKGAFNDIMGSIKEVFPFVNDLGTVFKNIGDFLSVTLIPILSFFLVKSIGVTSGAIQKFIYIIGSVKEAFMAVYNFIKGIFQFIIGDTQGASESMKKAFEKAFNSIKFAIKSIVAPFVGVINAISDAYNGAFGNFTFTVPKWVPVFGGKSFAAPKLPRINLSSFAEGGVIYPQTGGVIARVAEAGRAERIEPLDPSGLSNRDRAIIKLLGGESKGNPVTVNVYPSAGMDERELAAIVSRQLSYSLRKGAA